MTTPDATAQLVKLGKPEFIGTVDDNGIGIGDINACFDDGGTHQHIVSFVVKRLHDLLKLSFFHLTVSHCNPRFGHKLSHGFCHALNTCHIVMQ